MKTDSTVLQTSHEGQEVSGCSSFVDILRWRAKHQHDAVAFRFLLNGTDESCVMTFRQLDQDVRGLAAHLQQEGLTGKRVLLLYPSGPEYVIAVLACLYTGTDLNEIKQTVLHAVAQLNNVAVKELALVKRHSLPRTTNGKNKRAACRKDFLQLHLKKLFIP